jgi:hypothetical protein
MKKGPVHLHETKLSSMIGIPPAFAGSWRRPVAAALLGLLVAPAFQPSAAENGGRADAASRDDDSAMFASAVDQAMRTGLPLVLDPGRTYRLSRWTARPISGPLTIVGNGATLIGPAREDFIASRKGAGARPFHISGVVFDGWRNIVNFRDDNGTGHGGNADGFTFSHNVVRHNSAYALNIESPAKDYTIEDNTIEDGANGIRIGWNSFAHAGGWQGSIRDNSIGKLSVARVDLHAILAYGHDTRIERNKIHDLVARDGASVFGIYTKLTHSTVTRNEITELRGSGPEAVAIDLKGSEKGMDLTPGGFGTTAAENRIRGNGVAGRSGIGIRLQSDDQTAVGNRVEDFGKAALVVDEANGQDDVRLERNVVICTGAPGERGIEISSVAKGKVTRQLLVNGNTVSGCSEGLYFGGAGVHQDVRITDNEFDAGGTPGLVGINIANSHEIRGLVLSRNRVLGRFSHDMYIVPGRSRAGWTMSGNVYR